MMTFLLASFLALGLLFTAPARSGVCYSPWNEQEIADIYGKNFLQLPRVRNAILKAENEFGIDPRLLFRRMRGEGSGDPDIHNPTSKAYGIFQLLGKFYGESKTHEEKIKALYPKSPAPSRREKQIVQLEYYVNSYLAGADKSVRYSDCAGGNSTQMKDLDAFSQLLYLGWGSCGDRYRKQESTLLRSKVYTGEKSFIRTLKGIPADGVKLPICADRTPGAKEKAGKPRANVKPAQSTPVQDIVRSAVRGESATTEKMTIPAR